MTVKKFLAFSSSLLLVAIIMRYLTNYPQIDGLSTEELIDISFKTIFDFITYVLAAFIAVGIAFKLRLNNSR